MRVSATQLRRGVLGNTSSDGRTAHVRFDLAQINAESQQTGRMATGAATGAGVAAHEGDHAARRLAGLAPVPPDSRMARYYFEVQARRAEVPVYRAERVWGPDVSEREQETWIIRGAMASANQSCSVGAHCDD